VSGRSAHAVNDWTKRRLTGQPAAVSGLPPQFEGFEVCQTVGRGKAGRSKMSGLTGLFLTTMSIVGRFQN
jgi:hypothetical protein